MRSMKATPLPAAACGKKTGPKRRVMLVTPRFPFPALSGGEKWAASLAMGLSSCWEVSLFSFFYGGEEKAQAALAMSLEGRVFKKIFLLPEPGPVSHPRLPLQAARCWSRGAAAALAAAVRRTGTELVHLLFMETASYQSALPPSMPAVYTEIDSGYLHPSRSFLRETAGGREGAREEMSKCRDFAAANYGRFTAATFITAQDGRNIAPYLRTGITALTPNAVFPERMTPPEGARKKRSGILFVGHYPHYPNEDAALALALRIFPLVKRTVPGATLTLAGSSPTPGVKALNGPGISVPGTAADIRPAYWKAQIFAAPVRYGLGTKGKILEAFASGLPVVASEEAAAGVEYARAGEHLLVARSDRDFARQACRLLRDSRLRAALSRSALALVREKYSFPGVVSTVSSVYERALSAGVPAFSRPLRNKGGWR